MDDFAFLSDPHFTYTTAMCFGCILGFISTMLLVVLDSVNDVLRERRSKKKEGLNK